MKTLSAFFFSGVVCLFATCSATAQSAFQNLDFESATLVPIPGDPYGSVEFQPAFPGWSASIGGVQQTSALYNNLFLDSSGIGILDHGWTLPYAGVIEGSFTAVLQAGVGLSPLQPADTRLWQTGFVPIGSKSLFFRAYQDYPQGSFSVSLGGQTLALVPLSVGTNYTLFGADISAWSGQTAELSFTAIADNPHRGENNLFLDSIEFSASVVPEPSVLAISVLGTLLLDRRLASARGAGVPG